MLQKPPRKKQRQEERSSSASSTSTQPSRDATMQTILENERRDADLAEQIFGSEEPAVPRADGNEALETTSATHSDTIVVDCGPSVTPVAVIPAALHESVSAPASVSVIHEDADEDNNDAEEINIAPMAAPVSPYTEPSSLAAAELPPATTPTAPSTRPPHHTLHVYAAGILTLVKESCYANMPDARRIAGISPEQQALVEEIDVAIALGLDEIEAKIRGMFRKLEDK
jgi:hypothetical protein